MDSQNAAAQKAIIATGTSRRSRRRPRFSDVWGKVAGPGCAMDAAGTPRRPGFRTRPRAQS
ncbi:MAG: hypothetical protein OXQ29_02380, partial [Rhodospirillaceae bacterium]|nr:hypothetical protein [Rhodospirillaceae bacterium]